MNAAEQSAAELLDGLDDSQLEFLLYVLNLPADLRQMVQDMIDDALEIMDEGGNILDVERYLRRVYGL